MTGVLPTASSKGTQQIYKRFAVYSVNLLYKLPMRLKILNHLYVAKLKIANIDNSIK
jgi:hypothetical protein